MTVQDQQDTSTVSPSQRMLMSAPAGMPLTSDWMKEQGITLQMAYRLHRSGWLQSLGRGAWKRTNDRIGWQAAVYALQTQLQLSVWPAARSALELMGHVHYIAVGEYPQIQLCLGGESRLPDWYMSLEVNRNLRPFLGGKLFDPYFAGLMDWREGDFPLRISTPERAVLELCHLLPKQADAEEVSQLMSGLSGLRPEKLRELLLICRSIKGKRLFMALAEHAALPWLSALDTTGVDFGQGKRKLDWPGKLHPRYQITVPDAWLES